MVARGIKLNNIPLLLKVLNDRSAYGIDLTQRRLLRILQHFISDTSISPEENLERSISLLPLYYPPSPPYEYEPVLILALIRLSAQLPPEKESTVQRAVWGMWNQINKETLSQSPTGLERSFILDSLKWLKQEADSQEQRLNLQP